MDSSDEEVLLESCCFLLNYYQEVIKRKRKRTWMWDIFKKEQNNEVVINYCRRQCQRQGIVFQVICIMNFSAKVIKKNVRLFKVWLGLLFFTKILLKTGQLLSKHFLSGLSLCILYFIFIKARILLQFLSLVFRVSYMFSSFFSFS